jgi:predicted transposase/invertase (TIGR01784 family)
MAGNLLMSVSQDERERAVFRSRRMHQTDVASNLATAEDRGVQKGVIIGAEEKAIVIARNMIADGDSIDKIIRNTGLTREEIKNLHEGD